MANIFYQPYINPIQLFDLNRVALPQYLSNFMDDVRFTATIRAEEQVVKFILKWLKDDSIRLQYITNYNPLTLKMFSCDNVEFYSQEFDTLQEDFFNPGFFARQADLDLAAYEYGVYTLKVVTASGLVLGSEQIRIVPPEEALDTLLIEYYHRTFYEGIIFQTPFRPSIRIPARLKYKKTAAKSTVYEDQRLNEESVKSIPFRVHELTLGGDVGVPPYLIDKIARIVGCSNLAIDGRLFARNGEGSEFDANTIEDYPMAGWKIELREKINRHSLIYQDEVGIPGIAAAGLIVNTKGFGMNDQSGNDYLEIQSTE